MLEKYELNPQDPSVLINIANKLAAENKNDSALLFFENALELELDTESRHKVLRGISIHGYYSKIQRRQELGRFACEKLSMDRQAPWSSRWNALQNSTWYVKPSDTVIPGVRLTQVDFTPPDNYLPMNPSIINWGGRLWMIQRTVNYRITPSGHYDMRGDDAIRTRNWLLTLSDDLSVETANEILPPVDMPNPLYKLVIGFEDCRLFVWREQLWCSSTVRELNQAGYCQIVLARIDAQSDGNYRFADYKVIHPQGIDLAHQKNWMPLVVGDDLRFIYSSDPVRVIDDHGKTICLRPSPVASDSFRGGSQAITFDDGWVAIIHQSVTMHDNRRRYLHRFVKYDKDFNLVGYTESFYISKLGIEFAAGLARHPVTDDIVVSFGIDDRESWMVTFKESNVRAAFQSVPQIKFDVPPDDLLWIDRQTNTALTDKLSVQRSTTIISKLGLKQHEDAVKNWDNLQSLYHTIRTTAKDEWIMDVAATPGSAYLPSLHRYGYEKLISINLTDKDPIVIDGVIYQHGDCTRTDFPDGHFGFVSCLSVIEHGVDVELFLRESARIIKLGGYLFVSTDYWNETVDTRGQMAFGVPVRIFTQLDLEQMIEFAYSIGLELTSPAIFDCNERVVNWIGMDYTFMSLLFKKVST
jgi:SAM-dependent methyltransferase